MKRFYKAEVLHGECENVDSIVEAVEFHGVLSTKRDALKKEIEAGLYRAKNLAELLKNSHLAARHLQEAGLMDGVGAFIETSKESGQSYVVKFIVKEPKSFILGVKAGVTTHGDADLSLNAGKQSVMGRGENLYASFSQTLKGDRAFSISATKPLLGWQKYANVSASIYRTLSSLPWCHSSAVENALLLHFGSEHMDRRIRHIVRLSSVWRQLMPLKGAAFAVREHAGHTLKCSLENTIAYDTRDRRQLASSGMLLQSTQEYAGLLGDAVFFRNQFDVQMSARLGLGFILSAGARCSFVRAMGNRSLHLLDRSFLGGTSDIRGFSQNSVGPRADNSCIGGSTSYAAALHIYRPLFPPQMFFAHAFLTSGAVASVRSRFALRDMAESPRVSTGLGLVFVWDDLIRFELNYVLPIRYVPGDLLAPGVQLGIGVNFL